MTLHARPRPDWNRLFETAAGQEGHFSTEQAAIADFSPHLLIHHVKAGKLLRVRRGVYRLVQYPAGDHEELVAIWLWSDRAGVFSHHTALSLHGLSDVLPARVHLILPLVWRRRRLRVPAGVDLHFADLGDADRTWFGSVPATSVQRTLADGIAAHLPDDIMRQAIDQAFARGMIGEEDRAIVQGLAS
jgi:predicted transcriptional regulator of viral defense system